MPLDLTMADEAGPSIAPKIPLPVIIHYASHKRDELAIDIKPLLEAISPEEFRTLLRLSPEDKCPHVDIGPIISSYKDVTTKTTYHQLFNDIVATLKAGLPEEGILSLEFRAQRGKVPPDGTLCRPDLIAYDRSRFIVDPKKQTTNYETRSKTRQLSPFVDANFLAWTQLEVTGEFHSIDKNEEDSLLQAVTCTAYHLQARPDRVVVLGFYIGPSAFNLILTDASGTCHTKLLWTDGGHIELLRDFIYRILKPSPNMIDPTITRNRDSSFDIVLNGDVYRGCQLKWFGRPIGRRTTIFATLNPEVPIIKEQYLRTNSVEAENLKKIHENGRIPGVVRVHDHQEFQKGDLVVVCSIGKRRYKARLALKDTGTPFMDIQTPYEVLITTYDLLEATQCVYMQAGILHRDISKGNVLFQSRFIAEKQNVNSGAVVSHDASAEEQGERLVEKETRKLAFCSSLHLLDKNHPPEATPVLLIDLDHSAIYEEQRPQDSAGTPVFMARAAEAGEPIHPGRCGAIMPGMPEVVPHALPQYNTVWPERMKKFPAHPKSFILDWTQESAECKWFHELRHDAESIFWLLLWWAVHVRPDNDKVATPIRPTFWEILTTPVTPGYDTREGLMVMITNSHGWLDPTYRPLEELLGSMAYSIRADLHWVTDTDPEELNEPEYVHESLQRHILNFLVENKTKPFMKQKRHAKNRKLDGMDLNTSGLTDNQTRSPASRSSVAGASTTPLSAKRGRGDLAEDSQDLQRVTKKQRQETSLHEKK